MLPSGGPALAVVEIEIVDPQSLLIDRVVDGPRVDREDCGTIMIHEMSPDGENALPFALSRRFHARKALAADVEKEPLDLGVLAQFDVRVTERLGKPAALGVHLAGPRVGKGVPWRWRALEPGLDVDAEGQGKGMQINRLHSLANARDRGFIGNRPERKRRRVMRLGLVEAQRAMDLIEPFRACVPGLEFFIGEWPAGR